MVSEHSLCQKDLVMALDREKGELGDQQKNLSIPDVVTENDADQDDVTENDEDQDDENPYVDRGWAWMITLGSFILFLLVPGYFSVMSVLLLDIVEYYHTSITKVTIMQSACCMAYTLACQLTVNYLLRSFSVRRVTVIAAIVNALCTLLVVTSSHMAVFAVLHVMKFAAHGAMLTPSLTLVGMYFKKRRALASSLALVGLSLACVLVPQFVRYLRAEYGFKGCFLILAGYELHGVFATSLLRPLNDNTKTSEQKKSKVPDKLQVSADKTFDSFIKPEDITVSVPLILENGQNTNKSDHNPNKRRNISLSKQYFGSKKHIESSESISEICIHKISEHCRCPRKYSDKKEPSALTVDHLRVRSQNIYSLNEEQRERQRENHSVPQSSHGHLLFPQPRGTLSTLSLTPSLMPANLEFDLDVTIMSTKTRSGHILVDIIKSVFDISVLKNWHCFTCVVAFTLARCSALIVMYLPSHGSHRGLNRESAASLVTIFGVMDMLSRLMFGFIGDLHLTRPKFIIAFSSLISGTLACFISFLTTFETLVPFSLILGLFGAVTLSLNTSNIIDMTSLDMLGPLLAIGSNLMTLSWALQFPLLGLLIDASGSFLVVFYYCAVSYFISAGLLLSDSIVSWFAQSRKSVCHMKCSGTDTV